MRRDKLLINFILNVLFCIIIHYSAQAQYDYKKTIVELNADGLFSRGAVYHNGYGMNSAVYFPLSPSFNMGPQLYYAHIFTHLPTGPDHLDLVSLRLHILYFPQRFLRYVHRKHKDTTMSTFSKRLYIDFGLGGNFNASSITDNSGLNTVYWGLGYLLPLKTNALNIQLGINGMALNPKFTDEQMRHSGLYTISFGYSWITRHEKPAKADLKSN